MPRLERFPLTLQEMIKIYSRSWQSAMEDTKAHAETPEDKERETLERRAMEAIEEADAWLKELVPIVCPR